MSSKENQRGADANIPFFIAISTLTGKIGALAVFLTSQLQALAGELVATSLADKVPISVKHQRDLNSDNEESKSYVRKFEKDLS